MRRIGLVAVAVLAVAACSTKKPIIPADKLWGEGNAAFKDEAYEIAIDRYKALLDQHPFDANAEEAELRIAQSYYAFRRYPEAIAAFGDFERMHPTSNQLPLVEYHLGMAYLAQGSTADRDQESETNAYNYFRNLIDRFPNSEWSEKARLRMRECRESMARHEADIAAYYLRHGNLKAAEARLRFLLADYPETDATADALYTFAQDYARRKEDDGATLALATLVHHHPDGPLASDARRRLGEKNPLVEGEDPLPVLIGLLDQLSTRADRQNLPHPVSAYPDQPGARTY
jgi:outer membrane protein assembly factor BamD